MSEALSPVSVHSKNTDTQEETLYCFEFTGKTVEYFRIWIVNLFLTIITLGIYSAWAKVRTKRYFYGNTFLNHSSFDYTAEPKQILKGRVIALCLLAAYQGVAYFWPRFGDVALAVLVAIAPFVIVLSMRFRLLNTVWRGIRFGFRTDLKKAYWLFLPPILYFVVLAIVPFLLGFDFSVYENKQNVGGEEAAAGIYSYFKILGILVVIASLIFPWWQKKYYDFIGEHSRFGSSAFSLDVKTREFYRMYLVALVILVVGGFCAYLVLMGLLPRFSYNEALYGGMALISSLIVIGIYATIIVYVLTKKTNLIYTHLSLNEKTVQFNSQLSAAYMLYLYVTNTLAILVTFTLAIPWAMVRTAKYRASKTTVISDNLEGFISRQRSEDNAVGEEVGEMFGLDIGI